MPVLENNDNKPFNPLLDTLEEQIILAGRDTKTFRALMRDKNFKPEAYQKYFVESEKNWRFIQAMDRFSLQESDDEWTRERKKNALLQEIKNLDESRFQTDLLNLFRATNQDDIDSSSAWRDVVANTVLGSAPIVGTALGAYGGPLGAKLGGSVGTLVGKASEIAIRRNWPETEAEYRSAAALIDQADMLVQRMGIEMIRSDEALRNTLQQSGVDGYLPNFVLASTRTPEQNLKKVRSTDDRALLESWYEQLSVYGEKPSKMELEKLTLQFSNNTAAAVGNAAAAIKPKYSAAERAQRLKMQKNVDAGVYLASTLLSRTGSPDMARKIDACYEGYKQLQELSTMSMKTAGAAMMTAGYVGLALMLADAFMSSSKEKSKEEQMMKAIQQMFEALQKSIKEFRKEMETRLEGISNNQEQILNKLDTLSATIVLSISPQLTRIRRDIKQLQHSAQSMINIYSDTEYINYRNEVSEQLDNIKYAEQAGNEDRKKDIEKALRFLVGKTTEEYSSILWGMLYVGTNRSFEIWDSEHIIGELRPENIRRIDLKVGLAPAVVRHLQPGVALVDIPSPVEWASLVRQLIRASVRHPHMARYIMRVEGNYLRELQDTAREINVTFSSLLSKKTIDSAAERYKKLISEVCQLAIIEPYDETVLELGLQASGTVLDKSDESYATALRERRREAKPEFFPAAFSDAKIEELIARDSTWGNGRLRVTQRSALRTTSLPKAYGPVKRRSDKRYIRQSAFVAARNKLRLKDADENTVFLNETYHRRMQKGTDYRGHHKIKGNGKDRWTHFNNFSIRLFGRFVIDFDIVGKAELYGLLNKSQPTEFSVKPLLENDVFTRPVGAKNRSRIGKTTIYARMERKTAHKFASGLAKGTGFSLLESYLVAPKRPEHAFVSADKKNRMAYLANKENVLALSEKHRRLPGKLASFGSERKKVANTKQMLLELKLELFRHHNRIREAMLADSRNLILGVEAAAGTSGLSPTRYESKRKKLQAKLSELQALVAALRLIAGLGLIAKGVDPDVATGFARRQVQVVATPEQLVDLIDRAQKAAKLTMEEYARPVLLKDSSARMLQTESIRSLELFLENSLAGLAIDEETGMNSELLETLQGLENALRN